MISWRVIAILMNFIGAYVVTGRFLLSLGITSLGQVLSTVAYYVHERAWNKFAWGKYT